jgi:hypothetical protein
MNKKSTQKTTAPIMLKLKHANIYHNPKQKARGKKIKPFLLYYVKAIKRESEKVKKPSKIVGLLRGSPPTSPIIFIGNSQNKKSHHVNRWSFS